MIILHSNLVEIRDRFKHLKIGYTSGVFDLFHQGHLMYLEECKSYCDILVVGVDSNLLVKIRKGNYRPRHSITKRLEAVNNHSDFVFEKNSSSKHYSQLLDPNYFFYSENSPTSKNTPGNNLKNLAYEATFFVNYTESISTTKKIRTF